MLHEEAIFTLFVTGSGRAPFCGREIFICSVIGQSVSFTLTSTTFFAWAVTLAALPV